MLDRLGQHEVGLGCAVHQKRFVGRVKLVHRAGHDPPPAQGSVSHHSTSRKPRPTVSFRHSQLQRVPIYLISLHKTLFMTFVLY